MLLDLVILYPMEEEMLGLEVWGGKMSGCEIGESEARRLKANLISRLHSGRSLPQTSQFHEASNDQSNVLNTQPHQIVTTSRCFKR